MSAHKRLAELEYWSGAEMDCWVGSGTNTPTLRYSNPPLYFTLRLQAAQKDLRGEAREDRRAEAYSYCTLTRNRTSATKPMSLFQQPAEAH